MDRSCHPAAADGQSRAFAIIPVRRSFGGRWFDDVTVPRQMIEDILATQSSGEVAEKVEVGACASLPLSLLLSSQQRGMSW